MAKWTVSAENCKGCGLCVDACPKKILFIDPQEINYKGHSPVKIAEEARCTGCGFCSTMCPDCVITIVAYGIAARVSRSAVAMAREKGIRAGLIRPITLWPFPSEALLRVAGHVRQFLSVELSMGQMMQDIELAIRCRRPVSLVSRVGGMIPAPEQVLHEIERAAKGETL